GGLPGERRPPTSERRPAHVGHARGPRGALPREPLDGGLGLPRAALLLRGLPRRRPDLGLAAAAVQRAPDHRRRRLLPGLCPALRLGRDHAGAVPPQRVADRVRDLLGTPPRVPPRPPRRLLGARQGRADADLRGSHRHRPGRARALRAATRRSAPAL
ncbi:MAG: hypothetical protein AVDCRST_MAG45-2106, partial [uncultured Solirubrobacterales bacterium]